MERGFVVKINGRTQPLKPVPGTYLTLRRTWKDDDMVGLQMPFSFRLMPVMDRPDIASLFYGPVLLAAQESEARSTWRPITLDGRELQRSISGDPHTLRFEAGAVSFKPFYETYGRHSVYLDVTLE